MKKISQSYRLRNGDEFCYLDFDVHNISALRTRSTIRYLYGYVISEVCFKFRSHTNIYDEMEWQAEKKQRENEILNLLGKAGVRYAGRPFSRKVNQ